MNRTLMAYCLHLYKALKENSNPFCDVLFELSYNSVSILFMEFLLFLNLIAYFMHSKGNPLIMYLI